MRGESAANGGPPPRKASSLSVGGVPGAARVTGNSPCPVGATLVVARVGHSNAAAHVNTGDHKGRPYDDLSKGSRKTDTPTAATVAAGVGLALAHRGTRGW